MDIFCKSEDFSWGITAHSVVTLNWGATIGCYGKHGEHTDDPDYSGLEYLIDLIQGFLFTVYSVIIWLHSRISKMTRWYHNMI